MRKDLTLLFRVYPSEKVCQVLGVILTRWPALTALLGRNLIREDENGFGQSGESAFIIPWGLVHQFPDAIFFGEVGVARLFLQKLADDAICRFQVTGWCLASASRRPVC